MDSNVPESTEYPIANNTRENTNHQIFDTFENLNLNKDVKYSLLENQIDLLIRWWKLRKLEKHYWEREVKQRLLDISKKIQENPDRYWSFNSKWEFSLLTLDWKLVHKEEVLNLLKDSFSEYYKPDIKRLLYTTATSILPLIGFF